MESGSNPACNIAAASGSNVGAASARGCLKAATPTDKAAPAAAPAAANRRLAFDNAAAAIISWPPGFRQDGPKAEIKRSYSLIVRRGRTLPHLVGACVETTKAFVQWVAGNSHKAAPTVASACADKANLLKKADAQRLMALYNAYNYINMPSHSQVWETIGGTANDDLGPDSFTCAARVSQALCDYGVSLPPEPNLNNEGDFLRYKNKDSQIVFVRAISIHNYMTERLGPPAFACKADFDAMLAELEGKGFSLSENDNKPIIVWSEFVGKSGHVGMGYNGEGSASQGTFRDAQSIWVLYRPDLGDPEASSL